MHVKTGKLQTGIKAALSFSTIGPMFFLFRRPHFRFRKFVQSFFWVALNNVSRKRYKVFSNFFPSSLIRFSFSFKTEKKHSGMRHNSLRS